MKLFVVPPGDNNHFVVVGIRSERPKVSFRQFDLSGLGQEDIRKAYQKNNENYAHWLERTRNQREDHNPNEQRSQNRWKDQELWSSL